MTISIDSLRSRLTDEVLAVIRDAGDYLSENSGLCIIDPYEAAHFYDACFSIANAAHPPRRHWLIIYKYKDEDARSGAIDIHPEKWLSVSLCETPELEPVILFSMEISEQQYLDFSDAI